MSFKKELKKTALHAVLKPLGWILAIVGALVIIFGGMDVINGFSIIEFAVWIGGVIVFILGVALLRYGDKVIGKNPNRRR